MQLQTPQSTSTHTLPKAIVKPYTSFDAAVNIQSPMDKTPEAASDSAYVKDTSQCVSVRELVSFEPMMKTSEEVMC